MTPDQVAFWAMVGQWVGSIGTVIALGAVGAQVRQASRAADATTLGAVHQALSNELTNFTAARAVEGQPQAVINAFYSLVNFLELQAAAVNGRLNGSVSREIVSDLIKSAVADIEEFPAWNDVIQAGVDSPKTYAHLRLFCERNRREINEIKRHRTKHV